MNKVKQEAEHVFECSAECGPTDPGPVEGNVLSAQKRMLPDPQRKAASVNQASLPKASSRNNPLRTSKVI